MNMDIFFNNENEKPLDRIVGDGGMCAIFRTIGCIGDSLSSGEFEGNKADGTSTYHDMFEYSWGQFIARMTGSKVYNFSKGGMTADCYNREFADANNFWSPTKACQAYIIALGVNDIYGTDRKIGSVDDIDPENYENNKPTFAGDYAKIVQRLKTIQPDAKFFFVTLPNEISRLSEPGHETDLEKSRQLFYDLADYFSNSYVIDLYKYGPVYDDNFKNHFFLLGHMNPCGYLLTAKMIASYIDYIIRHNPEDFKQVGFIGTPWSFTE